MFSSFLQTLSASLCSDILGAGLSPTRSNYHQSPKLNKVLHTTTNSKTPVLYCAWHEASGHDSLSCRKIGDMDEEARLVFMRENKLCFRCLGSHFASKCKTKVFCSECESKAHCGLSHFLNRPKKQENELPKEDYVDPAVDISSESKVLCTQRCNYAERNDCSKIILADISDHKGQTMRVYVIVDEQSKESFCSPTLLDFFDVRGPIREYSITTLSSQKHTVRGRYVSRLKIRGVGQKESFDLPTMNENSMIPTDKNEIPTPEMVGGHPKISKYRKFFHKVDLSAEVAVLLGRDCGRLLWSETREKNVPFVHRTLLGWAVVGSMCPNPECSVGEHKVNIDEEKHKVMKICTLQRHEHFSFEPLLVPASTRDVFTVLPDEELTALPNMDRKFMNIRKSIVVNDEGQLETPLPFKLETTSFPDNRYAVEHRQANTLGRGKAKPDLQARFVDPMKKNVGVRHIEKIPDRELDFDPGKSFNVPVFPVDQPPKGKVRSVCDPAGTYRGAFTDLTEREIPGDRVKEVNKKPKETCLPKRKEKKRRVKWKTPRKPLKVGDVVLIRDKIAMRLHGPMGVVELTNLSHDDVVRKIKIRALDKAVKSLVRASSELILLMSPDS